MQKKADTIREKIGKGGLKMNSNDFVKYLTVQFVQRMNQSEKKEALPKQKISLTQHWLGLIPFSVKMLLSRSGRR